MTTSWGPSTSQWARIRQALAEVPRRYLKCIKTDCLVMQDVPKKYRPAVERLLKMSHRDGTPVYRYEEVTGLKGQYEAIRAASGGPREPLPGESLLLTLCGCIIVRESRVISSRASISKLFRGLLEALAILAQESSQAGHRSQNFSVGC